MAYTLNLLIDRMCQGRPYPNLARHPAEPYTQAWREFAHHWPKTVPFELALHCERHGVPVQYYDLDTAQAAAPEHLFYPIGLGWFDFTLDYFDLIDSCVQTLVRSGQVQVLFWYHEGDNPQHIQQRLNWLCEQHEFPLGAYRFVSGNRAADQIPGFYWFPDHELIYWQRNRHQTALPWRAGTRPYNFTVLNRTHKWWRAAVMADLARQGLLNHSLYSYSTAETTGDCAEDSPIEIGTLGLAAAIDQFLAAAPYRCDDLTSIQHNDHASLVARHYTESACHVVIETLFDADGSGGAFLTEKTFKPIRHAQPFVIVGCAGSLAALRDLGYNTFDHVIDPTYDTVANNTERWLCLRETLRELTARPQSTWLPDCQASAEHNQQLFLSGKHTRLNSLLERIYHDTQN